jgi:hypothetical protein
MPSCSLRTGKSIPLANQDEWHKIVNESFRFPKEVYPSWSPCLSLFKIGNQNGANGMSDMAGNAARVAVECGGRCRDTNRQSQIHRSLFKDKDDQFRTDAQGSTVGRPNV